LNSQAPVFLHGGGDSGHKVLSPLSFFALEWCWSKVFFPFFTALMMQFIWLFYKVLSPWVASTKGFISFLLFPALARAVTKLRTSVIALSGGNSGDSCGWVVTAGKQRI
jgi:hypothetical protein